MQPNQELVPVSPTATDAFTITNGKPVHPGGSILNRGRASYSTVKHHEVERQRSATSTLDRRYDTHDNELPSTTNTINTLTRAQSAAASPNRYPTRTLSRTQSNVSVAHSGGLPSPSRVLDSQDSCSSRNHSVNGRREATSPPPTPSLSNKSDPQKISTPSIPGTKTTAASTPAPARQPTRGKPLAHKPETSRTEKLNKARSEIDSIGAFALEQLFAAFAQQADAKIELCCRTRVRISDQIEDVCASGIDSGFDQLLSAMGRVVRHKPKPLIDMLFNWKVVLDEGKEAPNTASPSPDPVKHSMEIVRASPDLRASHATNMRTNAKLPTYSPDAELVERRSSVGTYLLCRALIEILDQTSLSSLTAALAVLIGDIAFGGTVSKITQDDMRKSCMQRAKWVKAVELLSVLSRLDFSGVMGRYLQDLQKHKQKSDLRNGPDTEAESKSQTLLKGMGQLQPVIDNGGDKVIPAWIELIGRLKTIQEMFSEAHGQDMKNAYCNMIEGLLLRFAGNTQSISDDPKWFKVLTLLYERFNKLAAKPKYWATAFPAQVAVVCVSPREMFVTKWQQMISSIQNRLKERTQRPATLKAICRLVWCDIRRNVDSVKALTMPLQDLIKGIFFSTRKFSLSKESSISQPLIQLIRIIGANLPDFCFKTIIFPLINADLLVVKETFEHQALDPDRMVIGIQAALAVINDSEQQKQPEFPLVFEDEYGEHSSFASMTSFWQSGNQHSSARQEPRAKGERFSKPVITSALGSSVQSHYLYFCKILGRIIRVCDYTFGGQAVLDEKFASPTMRTPLMDPLRFARDDDRERYGEERYGFYDLLHVSVRALPRCLSLHTPINELANLLCTGTAHVEKDIASSSAMSLKSIARQGHAQVIVARFSAFIFKYENRYATMSDGGLLGPAHIESTLQLYIELLQVWVDELHHKGKDATHLTDPNISQNTRTGQLDASTSRGYVDRVEAQGLFFLCSPSSRVRSFAIDVLELVTRLDRSLGETNLRVHDVLTTSSSKILDLQEAGLSVSERARLQRAIIQGRTGETLIELCKSGDPADANLWSKIFPRLVKAADTSCTMSVAQTRDDVCSRLTQIQPAIEGLPEERARAPTVLSMDGVPSGAIPRINTSLTDITVEQWRLYLIFACTTINRTTPTIPSIVQDSSHTRQSSRSSQNSQDSMNTATELFAKVVPLLFAYSASVRSAAVTGLGSINVNLYKPLLDALASTLQPQNRFHSRSTVHSRAASSPQVQSPHTVFHTEVVQVYEVTSHFLKDTDVVRDETVMDHLSTFIRDLALHLGQTSPQAENLGLRRYFCGLLENFFLSLNRIEDPMRWMPFQTRKAIYVALEEWCDQLLPLERGVSRYNDGVDGSHRNHALIQVENQKLRLAAWSAMATLCAGPMQINGPNGGVHQFSVPRLLGWIDTLLTNEGDKPQSIGRRALKNLITHNRKYTTLTESTIEKLYGMAKDRTDKTTVKTEKIAKTVESYLEVLSDVVDAMDIPPIPAWKITGALLFTLGHLESSIRIKSLRLLRAIEERHSKSPKLRNYDIMVSDKTRAVNLRAQYALVCEIIEQHEDYVYHIFSVYSRHLVDQEADAQRNMITVLLPWMRLMDLQVDSDNRPTATSYMVLLNMLYITVRCGAVLHTELQALWHGLITGNFRGNVSSILNFVINTSLECRDETFIRVAKQVMVYMASVDEGQGVVEFFMNRIDPRTMAGPDKRISLRPPPGSGQLPFIAGMSQIFPNSGQQAKLSMGQLSLVLLVDLVVDDHRLALENLPSLLQIVLVLWDHHLDIVQDQAREMLIHLVHVIVISKVNKAVFESREPSVDDLVDLIRRHEPKVVWRYTDNIDQTSPYDLPNAMTYVVSEAVSLFALTVPSVAQSWGEVAIMWALQCPVKHLACRSLQLYRCLHTPVSARTFSELILRSSTTVADDTHDMQAYATDLLRTVRTMAFECQPDSILQPQIYWFTCACLDSKHSWEYNEALAILNIMLNREDFPLNPNAEVILKAKPGAWQSDSSALIDLVLKGCQIGEHLIETLNTLERLIKRVPSPLVGDRSHIPLVLLAHMPRLLQSFEDVSVAEESLSAARTLRDVCHLEGHESLATIFNDYITSKIKKRDFLTHCAKALTMSLEVEAQVEVAKFLLGLLVNTIPWMKMQTLVLLGSLLPTMQFIGLDVLQDGGDLFSPLLQMLQTDFCAEALNVIDLLLPASEECFGQKHLSAARIPTELNHTAGRGAQSSPASNGGHARKSSKCQKQVRANLLELAKASGCDATFDTPGQPTPDIEFYKDEYTSDSYFPDYVAAASDAATMTETNMGELVSQLDTLDDFFDDVDDDHENYFQGTTTSMQAEDHIHRRRQRRKSGKTDKSADPVVSTTPFAHGLKHEPQVMSPSAFATFSSSTSKHTPSRPSISRSVTMPAGDFETTPPEKQSGIIVSQDPEVLSDDDLLVSRNNDLDRVTTMVDGNGTIRPNTAAGKPKFGLRNSIRRLASTASADKHRRSPTAVVIKASTTGEESPQVPRVPDEYRHTTQPSEI